jgi:glycosyltransferase involved in cell wall biosynthesis
MKTILIFDQAESAGGSIARAVDLANQMQDFQFVFITYHPLDKLYNTETASNIVAKRIYSFYNYQKKYAHLESLKRKTKNKLLIYAGIKLIALADFINECSVTSQALIKIRSIKIDLVQANGGVHYLPYRLAELRKAALIYYFRHLDDYRWAAGKMLGRASEFVFVGANLMQRHLALLNLPFEKCNLVHSPFDAQKALAKASKSDLAFLYDLKNKGYFVILQAARVCREKGQHVSIDALIKLKDSYPNIALILAGEFAHKATTDYQHELHKKVTDNQLADRVLFIGQRKDILQLVHASDMALQSPLWFEALSGSLIEAMQLGVLTVSANMGGASEAIIHNQTGLLFTAGDSEELAQLISRILEKQIDTKLLAEAGREHAYRYWKSETVQQQMRTIYCRAIAKFDHDQQSSP